MAPSLGVDHRGGGIATHARRSHEMPASGSQERIEGDLASAGRFQCLARARDAVIEHAPAVLAQGVRHAGRGDSMAVGERRIEVHAVRRLGQVLADDGDRDRTVEALVVHPPVLASPGHAVTDRSAGGRGDRREPAGHLKRVAAHEAAREVGLVEFLADDAAADRTSVAAERPIEDAAHHRVGMEHEVPADQPAAIREPVGEARRTRVQQESWRADPVGGQHHRTRLLRVHAPLAVVVDRAVGESVRTERDLAHAGARDEARA